MKYVYIEFPNGEVYRVPARIPAESRARYYAEKDHPNDVEKQKEVKQAEIKHALGDELELFDWLRNNMNWEGDRRAIKPHATRVQSPQEDDKSDFYNTADLELRNVDPNDDPDKPDRTPPGIYLVNAMGEMTALATEDGGGDRQLLNEALDNHGVEQ